ncbi:ferredoxin--NADP(+) reductase [Bordetella sp. J329]|nr:ferredoxin--NADP(+) reductase [Bordetella sp. J329]
MSTDADKYTRQTLLTRTEWMPGKLFSVRVSRPEGFSFQPGQFARLGLPEASADDAAPTIWRAYSMVSAPDEAELEFYSVVVPEGDFSTRLAQLAPGASLYIDRTVFGFLTLERFVDGEDIWLVASGTGLSAYLSMLRDPALWQRFPRVILAHGVREVAELAYRQEIEALARRHQGQLIYLPLPTREAYGTHPQARLTHLFEDGRLEQLAGVTLDPARSRIMLCGNPDMVADTRKLLSARGFAPGRRGNAGNLAVENYW